MNDEKKPNLYKQLSLFLLGCIGIYLISFIFSFVAELIIVRKVGIENLEQIVYSNSFDLTLNGAVYGTLLLIELVILKTDFIKLIKNSFKLKAIVIGVIACFAIMAFDIFYSLFFELIKSPISTGGNQQSIEESASASLFWSLVIFGVCGPICEELTYRVGLFDFLKRKSKILAYLVTSLIFGAIHIIMHLDGNIINELKILPVYAFAGFTFSYIYDKYGLTSSLTAHILNNVISLSLVMFIR